jgi:hypothetical protein
VGERIIFTAGGILWTAKRIHFVTVGVCWTGERIIFVRENFLLAEIIIFKEKNLFLGGKVISPEDCLCIVKKDVFADREQVDPIVYKDILYIFIFILLTSC